MGGSRGGAEGAEGRRGDVSRGGAEGAEGEMERLGDVVSRIAGGLVRQVGEVGRSRLMVLGNPRCDPANVPPPEVEAVCQCGAVEDYALVPMLLTGNAPEWVAELPCGACRGREKAALEENRRAEASRRRRYEEWVAEQVRGER